MCEKFIVEGIDHENIFDFLELSSQFEAHQLRAQCLKFFAMNPTDISKLNDDIQVEIHTLKEYLIAGKSNSTADFYEKMIIRNYIKN